MLVSVVILFLASLSCSSPAGSGGESDSQQGTTLTVGIEAAPVDVPFRKFMPLIKERLGVDLEIVTLEYGSLFEKILTDLITGTGAFDIIVYFTRFNGDYMGPGFLHPLDEFIERYPPDYDDLIPAFRELYCEWEGHTYALPFDGDYFLLYYRKDLFQHPLEREAFQQAYGYPLAAPETWDQWNEIAEFFTRKAGEQLAGEVLQKDFYGISEYWGKARAYAWYLNRFGAYSGLFFDAEMEPKINSADAVRALEHCLESVRYNTPGPLAHTWWNVREDFLFGKVAMIFGWPDVGKATGDPVQSKVIGKVGFAPSPGVLDPATGKIRRATALVSGRVMAVSRHSSQPEAAYQVIRLISSPEISLQYIGDPASGSDPFRYSHFEHPQSWQLQFDGLDQFLKASRDALDVGFPELYIPGAEEYQEALSRHVQEALQEKVPPQQALDAVAKEWAEITKRRGREDQKRFWRTQLTAMQRLNLIPGQERAVR